MGLEITLIALEALICLLFMPIKVGVRAHASLGALRLCADISLYKIRAIRIRGSIKGGKPVLTINGKPPERAHISAEKLLALPSEIGSVGVKKKGAMAARIGMGDAALSSALCAAVMLAFAPLAPEGRAYPDRSDGMYVDLNVDITINLVQIAQIAL